MSTEVEPIPATSVVEGAEIAALRRRLWLERAVFGAILAGIIGARLYMEFRPKAWALYVDGKPVVAMTEKRDLEALVKRKREAHGGSAAGVTYLNSPRIAPIDPARLKPVDSQSAEKKIEESVQVRAPRAVLYVDGIATVALPDEAAAKQVLEKLKSSARSGIDKPGEVTLKEEVSVRVEPAEEKSWADVDTALAF